MQTNHPNLIKSKTTTNQFKSTDVVDNNDEQYVISLKEYQRLILSTDILYLLLFILLIAGAVLTTTGIVGIN